MAAFVQVFVRGLIFWLAFSKPDISYVATYGIICGFEAKFMVGMASLLFSVWPLSCDDWKLYRKISQTRRLQSQFPCIKWTAKCYYQWKTVNNWKSCRKIAQNRLLRSHFRCIEWTGKLLLSMGKPWICYAFLWLFNKIKCMFVELSNGRLGYWSLSTSLQMTHSLDKHIVETEYTPGWTKAYRSLKIWVVASLKKNSVAKAKFECDQK